MKPTQEQVKEFVKKELIDFNGYALEVLKTSLRQRGLVVTEELLNSLFARLMADSADKYLGGTVLGFNDVGRYLDMKFFRQKPLPQKEIETVLVEWVKKVGVNKWAYVPGYKKNRPLDDNIAANRIAWGIGRGVKNPYRSGKRWYAKKMGGLILGLAERLVTDYATVIASSTAHQLSE